MAVTIVATTLAVPARGIAECLSGHLGVRWASFQPPVTDFGPVFFYRGVEGTPNVTVTVMGVGDNCAQPPPPVFGMYEVSTPSGVDRAATPGADYTPIVPPRSTGPLYGYHSQGPTHHTDSVPIVDDVTPETVVEQARATITSSTGYRSQPFIVPLYVVDDDGLDRASFASAGPYERAEVYGRIDVPVLRAGPASGAATFEVVATGTSGSPATPGDDFTLPPSVTFGPGERAKFVTVTVADDGRSEPTEELTITLAAPGAVLPSDPVSATVRILDGMGRAGTLASSSLHHPNHRKRYRASDYKIREIHIFTQAGNGPPVTAADFALRRNRKGKKGMRCAWWDGKRFRSGGCDQPRWLRTGTFEPDFFYYRLQRLRPTKKRIKSYTAFSRARVGDVAETVLEKGRNANTFKVRPAKKRRR